MKILVLLIYFLGITGLMTYTISYCKSSIPNNIYIEENKENEYDFNLPVLGSAVYNDSQVPIDLTQPLKIKAGSNGSYAFDIKLFGLYTIKTVNVNVVEKQQVLLGGFPIGIYVKYDGVMVAQTTKVTDYLGNQISPCKDKVYAGDYILEFNGKKLESKEQLLQLVNEHKDADAILKIRRNGEIIEVKTNAVLSTDKSYKLGLWIRDDTQGVGTITYIKPNGEFGSLGHGIGDIDTGRLIEISSGKLYETKIMTIIPGKESKPGEFVGIINYNNKYLLGSIYENSDSGIFGKFEAIEKIENPIVADVAYCSEIEIGEAFIRSYVSGEPKDYKIEITRVDLNATNSNKGIEFKVTDSELLKITNGIVQGMSGSPVIQNGRIIGAVTHVLVNDPTKGYAIFIENMLEHDN
ncbi:MAG: SpoIVB peptidase [Lachnospira sp.]|nr:SpoIVB peptidase [Lachnospira sp.]